MEWDNFRSDNSGDSEYAKMRKRIIKWVSWGIGVIILLIVLLNSTTRVNPGFAGVQYSLLSGMKEEVLKEGLRWHAPWVNVYEYPVSTETVALRNPKKDEDREDDSIQVNTADTKSVAVDVRYAYKMKEDQLPYIFKRFRRQDADWIADNYIKAEILNITQSVTTKNSVIEVYSQNREKIASEVRDELEKSLAEDGIVLEKFTFTDVRPDKKTQDILQQVADAENQRELLKRQEKNSAQEANNIAQQKKNEEQAAEADKRIAKINAEKQAEVTLIEAKAQAQANKELSKSITQTLVDYEIAKKADKIEWPKVFGGGNMLQLPQNFLDNGKKDE